MCMPWEIRDILHEIVEIRDYELQILERLGEVHSGNRGLVTGSGIDCPPVVSPAMVV